MTFSFYISDDDPLAQELRAMPAKARSYLIRRALAQSLAAPDGYREIIHKISEMEERIVGEIVGLRESESEIIRHEKENEGSNHESLATPDMWESVLSGF